MRSREYVFVLWADHFDAAAAAIFVTELREAGLTVKLLGPASHRSSGSHGLALVPDLTLDQAMPLATQARCLVVPAALPAVQALGNDPRWQRFFTAAKANQALVVLDPSTAPDVTSQLAGAPALERVLIYPPDTELLAFVRELAGQLAAPV